MGATKLKSGVVASRYDLVPHIFLAVFAGVWLVTAIRPLYFQDWFLENLLVFATVPVLVGTYRRFRFSNLSYLLITLFLILHVIGAHYTYSEVPLGNWLRDGWQMSRNHYDRVVHFTFGLFLAKDPACNTPDLLAVAVRKHGGLIHNNHPSADAEGEDQFAYAPSNCVVIANTEMWPDTTQYEGKTYHLKVEQTLRAFLNQGGKTGFVAGSDTHEGKPAARTAVLVRELTREAIFDALRKRRNYAINHARIVLDFRINGHVMGEEIEIAGKPQIVVEVKGTDTVEEVIIVRDGSVLHAIKPGARVVRFDYTDHSFNGASYYYVRVLQADKDQHGNHSHAWSSPIWVKGKR